MPTSKTREMNVVAGVTGNTDRSSQSTLTAMPVEGRASASLITGCIALDGDGMRRDERPST